MITLCVNGEMHTFERQPSVKEVLEKIEAATSAAVAVEVNRAVVPRAAHATRVLDDGDQVEIVTFVGGG